MSVDFEKVLKEKLSEETFSIISSSEKEFVDWLDRLKRDAERCGELYEKAVMVKQNRRIRFAKGDSVKIKIKDLLWEIGQNAIIIICWEFGQWIWSWLL